MPSTVIRTFRYEAGSNRLFIEFQSGRRYMYRDVPPQVFAGMRRAGSRGAYFNAQVRDRYDYEQLDAGDDAGS